MSKLRNAGLKAFSVARKSWGGRILFVGHLWFMIVILRHYEIDSFSKPVLAFAIVDSPQLVLLRFIRGLFGTTEWSWTFLGLFISIPWWAYGMAVEFAIRRIVSSKLSLSAKGTGYPVITLK
jgi:hypothetical protein